MWENEKDYNLRRWRLFAYISFIFISAPYLPSINSYANSKIGDLTIIYTVAVIVALLTILFLYLFRGVHNKKRFFLWGLPIIIFSPFFIYFISIPIERIHFIEYLILSMLIFKSIYKGEKTSVIFIYSIIITFFIGVSDELWQGFLPNRYFDYHDIAINGISGIIGQFFIYGIMQPDLHES